MAKQKKKDNEALKAKENTPPDDKTEEQPKPPEDGTKSDDGAVIESVAFEVKLKSIHPQATYGRCGYRFNKTTVVRIPCEALSGEQISALADDPYLDFVPVVEDDA